MRLSQTEIEAISQTIRSLDDQARIRLFGSRADDAKKGGDIDLLILSEKLSESDRGMIRLRLHEKLGEQKIDIVIARDLSDPFVRVAFNEGAEIAMRKGL
ncbi:MAG TPA: nucleotidyltransferase domain-containing protein [Syntrophales bacterium]|nr:nucleotidyltransferase domain-containing protein [Syntrophales bacterium]